MLALLSRAWSCCRGASCWADERVRLLHHTARGPPTHLLGGRAGGAYMWRVETEVWVGSNTLNLFSLLQL